MSPTAAASARSMEIRSERAVFRKEVAAMPRNEGAARVAEVLEGEPGEAVGSFPIAKLLATVRLFGDYEVEKLITDAGLYRSPVTRRLRDLHLNERLRLAAALRRRTRVKR